MTGIECDTVDLSGSSEALRTYGRSPFRVAVVHGGPGAAGEMAPVARELAPRWGVLEPLQTEMSLGGQVQELKDVLVRSGDPPVILIGFSWGAWLGYIVAAEYPSLVKKLVLVGCGPFEHKYAASISTTRLSRLNAAETVEYQSIVKALDGRISEGQAAAFARLGALASVTDQYDPVAVAPEESGPVAMPVRSFHGVLKEAQELRRSGKLLELATRIQCPVTAIHGDYDPHPAEGVQKPLSAALESFRFILLKNCGHKPWTERQAKSKFYEILREEIS
jgi:pimeloyl-ACP methyl ester carboxylesterase